MFEPFDLSKKHLDAKPRVSISQYGKFSFNVAATRMLESKGLDLSVVLLFDKDTFRVGIRNPLNVLEHEYKITYHHNCYFTFSAIAFIKHIKFPVKKTLRFPIEWDEKNKMCIVDLSFIYGQPIADNQ